MFTLCVLPLPIPFGIWVSLFWVKMPLGTPEFTVVVDDCRTVVVDDCRTVVVDEEVDVEVALIFGVEQIYPVFARQAHETLDPNRPLLNNATIIIAIMSMAQP